MRQSRSLLDAHTQPTYLFSYGRSSIRVGQAIATSPVAGGGWIWEGYIIAPSVSDPDVGATCNANATLTVRPARVTHTPA